MFLVVGERESWIVLVSSPSPLTSLLSSLCFRVLDRGVLLLCRWMILSTSYISLSWCWWRWSQNRHTTKGKVHCLLLLVLLYMYGWEACWKERILWRIWRERILSKVSLGCWRRKTRGKKKRSQRIQLKTVAVPQAVPGNGFGSSHLLRMLLHLGVLSRSLYFNFVSFINLLLFSVHLFLWIQLCGSLCCSALCFWGFSRM